MTSKYIFLVMGEGIATLWPSADDSSKQELQNGGGGREHLSFTLSIITM